MSSKKKLPPIHPGLILKEEFMVPYNLSANRLALKLYVPPGRISSIINGTRGITADTALRLAKCFRNSPEFWMNLQSQYDLQLAEATVLALINKQVRPIDDQQFEFQQN
jgi:addiction module HigA family antidote